MIETQVKFTIEFTVTLDGVPGWGNTVEDWVKLATADVLRQSHYHTSAKQVGATTTERVCHSGHEFCLEYLQGGMVKVDEADLNKE